MEMNEKKKNEKNQHKRDNTLLTEVTFACDDSITMWTVKLGHILRVLLQNMHLHGATLREPGVTDVALIRLLT